MHRKFVALSTLVPVAVIFANECYQLKDEQKAEQANQIGVIDLPHLIENRGIILTK